MKSILILALIAMTVALVSKQVMDLGTAAIVMLLLVAFWMGPMRVLFFVLRLIF